MAMLITRVVVVEGEAGEIPRHWFCSPLALDYKKLPLMEVIFLHHTSFKCCHRSKLWIVCLYRRSTMKWMQLGVTVVSMSHEPKQMLRRSML